jgi:hypothetical protein
MAVVGGVGGAAGVAGGLIVEGAVPGEHGIGALVGAVGVLAGTPAVGLDGLVLFTPDVVDGLPAVAFGICAGVFVPGVFVPGVAAPGVVAVAGGVVALGAGVVPAGVVEPGAVAPLTGTHGTVVRLPGVVGVVVVGVVVVGVGACPGVCASGTRPMTNAPASATTLIDMFRVILTEFLLRSMSFGQSLPIRCCIAGTNRDMQAAKSLVAKSTPRLATVEMCHREG